MKPLTPAPLTDEDLAIFFYHVLEAVTHPDFDTNWQAYVCQDRRDAHLMWLREWSKSDSEQYHDECWELNRRAWWPVHWGLA